MRIAYPSALNVESQLERIIKALQNIDESNLASSINFTNVTLVTGGVPLFIGDLLPSLDGTYDLGGSLFEWQDLRIDGLAYIDGFGEDTDMGDFDIHSIDGLYGYDDNVFIDMGTDGRIIIQADGAGTPFSTPDIDITGTSYFDDDIGLLLDKKIMFGDTGVYILSDDDGHLDLTADVSIDLNGYTIINGRVNFTESQVIKRTATAVSYSTLTTDYLIGVTNTDAARTVTLESDAAAIAGFVYRIKDESGGAGTNNITIATEGGETIDGAATFVLNSDHESITVYSDGTNWNVV